jgi:hypothetical protein
MFQSLICYRQLANHPQRFRLELFWNKTYHSSRAEEYTSGIDQDRPFALCFCGWLAIISVQVFCAYVYFIQLRVCAGEFECCDVNAFVRRSHRSWWPPPPEYAVVARNQPRRQARLDMVWMIPRSSGFILSKPPMWTAFPRPQADVQGSIVCERFEASTSRESERQCQHQKLQCLCEMRRPAPFQIDSVGELLSLLFHIPTFSQGFAKPLGEIWLLISYRPFK